MTSNPIQQAKRVKKELEQLWKEMEEGYGIPKSRIDSLMAAFKNYSELSLAFGHGLPVFGTLSNMTYAHMERLYKQSREDLDNKDLFYIDSADNYRRVGIEAKER